MPPTRMYFSIRCNSGRSSDLPERPLWGLGRRAPTFRAAGALCHDRLLGAVVLVFDSRGDLVIRAMHGERAPRYSRSSQLVDDDLRRVDAIRWRSSG